MAEFKLPDVGEGLTEAEIVAWKVKPGDEVTLTVRRAGKPTEVTVRTVASPADPARAVA